MASPVAALAPGCDVVVKVPEGLACVFGVFVGVAEERDVASDLRHGPLS